MPTNQVKPLEQQLPDFIAPVGEKVNEIARKITPVLNLKAGTGILIVPSGTDIVIAVDSANAVASSGHPFKGTITSGVLRIQNGDINSDVPPEVQGGSSPVDYDTDDYVYYVSAEFDADGVYVGPVAVGRGASVPADTSTVAYRRIFEVLDGSVMQSVQNSLEVIMCAGVASWGSV